MNTAMKASAVIINATMHVATPEQVKAGVIASVDVADVINFYGIPSKEDMEISATEVAERIHAKHVEMCEPECLNPDYEPCYAMIGGAPFFMAPLERALKSAGITPIYAFSKRESVEEHMPDGTVVKRNVFKHLGFVGL